MFQRIQSEIPSFRMEYIVINLTSVGMQMAEANKMLFV